MATVADLGQLVKRKYPGKYDSIADEDLGLLVQQKYPGKYSQFSAMPKTFGSRMRDVATGVANQLPVIGGAAGGFAGGGLGLLEGGVGAIPGAAIGAGVGGTGGAVLKNMILTALHDPNAIADPREQGLEFAKQGAAQGVVQGAGDVAANAAITGGKALMEAVVGPQGFAAANPAVTMMKEGINASKSGYNKLVKKIIESSQTIKTILGTPAARAVRYNLQQDVLDPVASKLSQKAFDEFGGEALPMETLNGVADLSQQLRSQNPSQLSAKDIYRLKRAAGRKVRSFGPQPNEEQLVPLQFWKALQNHTRELLQARDATTFQPLFPGLAEADARSSALLDLGDRLRSTVGSQAPAASRLAAATVRHVPGAVLGTGAAFLPAATPQERIKHAVGGVAAGEALSNPQFVMLLARLLQQSPRALYDLDPNLLNRFSSAPSDATNPY